MGNHAKIAEAAREIWEKEGRPRGRDRAHWEQAEKQVTRERLDEDMEGRPQEPSPEDYG